MDGKALAGATRMAQNLPVPKTTFDRVKTPEGEVYIAYGKGKNWHGLYAIEANGGMAQEIQYAGQTTAEEMRNMLILEGRRVLAVCQQ